MQSNTLLRAVRILLPVMVSSVKHVLLLHSLAALHSEKCLLKHMAMPFVLEPPDLPCSAAASLAGTAAATVIVTAAQCCLGLMTLEVMW